MVTGKRGKADADREVLRESLWPNSGDKVWKSTNEVRFFQAPRSLPLFLRLLREKNICGKLDPSRVYEEFFSRHWGQGIVEVLDEDDHAYCAGYDGPRALRTWRERVNALAEVGFIRVFTKANRKIGYVILVDPRLAALELRRQGKVSDIWWQTFQERQRKVKAPTDVDPMTEKKRPKVVRLSRSSA